MGDTTLSSEGDLSIGGDVVHRDKITTFQEAPAPLALNLHQIHPPPRDFTGRAAELTELLANFENGVAISGLHGQGGIGKTALALKLAEELRPRYPDAQFYLDLKGVSDKPLTPAEALAHVIRAYHPTSKLPEGEAELRGLYQSVLHEKRALLLMDNAKDAAQVEPLLPPATCCLLVTSRQHFHLPGVHTKNLDALPPDDARELLIRIAPRISSSPIGPSTAREKASRSAQDAADGGGRDGVADEIAKLCGYLPLALRVTASALAERIDLSPADYIRRLSDTQQRLKLMDEVEASLQLSYDLLTAELQKLWRALAVFPETFDRAAATAVWAMEEDPAQDALSELVKYSLLDFTLPPALTPPSLRSGTPLPSSTLSGAQRSRRADGRGERPPQAGGGEGRYRLHDLARLYADTRLTEPERYEAQQRHAEHYAEVFGRCNQLLLRGGADLKSGLSLFDTEWPNIQAGQRWAGQHANDNETAAQACNRYGWQGSLLGLRFHPRDQIRWMEAALIAARQLKNRQAEGAHLTNLGLAYADLGETRKAIEFYEQHVTIAREIGDRRGEGAALGNLGLAYADLGETRKAIEFYEQALPIFREIGDRRGEGAALTNVGLAYGNLGETHKAIEYYEQALVIDRETGDRRGEGNALMNIGNAHNTLGEPRQAIEFHEQALSTFREIGDRRGEGKALGNLGNACYALGESRKAIEYNEQSAAVAREIGNKRDEGAALGSIGVAYFSLGETHKAIEYYEQWLTIAREIGDRRGEGNALWNTSLALDKLGDRTQAIAHAEAALKIYEQIESPVAEKARKQLEAWRG